MGFKGNRNNADGRDPDFGAIFMSNTGTKRECFKRRLFGLPSPEIHFVEQVKAGMILFLFEYEKRQLHGLFRASCDGAMNIVPNAFSSSGKQFPAQVKFSMIWHCKPLPESLFHDAIRENYFSAHKFNFGLSEKQVYKLLKLFSTRKLELEFPRPTISGGYSKSPSDKIRVDGEDILSVSDRLMSEDPTKNGARMVFSADSPHLHHSNVNPSVFYGEPFLECNCLIENQIRSTSAVIHSIQAQFLDNSCATQGDASSKNPLLYDPDDPGFNFSKLSFVRNNNDSRSVLGSASPSNNCRWNSLSDQPSLMHTELKDINWCHRVGYGFPNCLDCMPFNMAQNSDQLAAESVAYGAGNSIYSLKSSPAPVPPPADISGRVYEPFSSLFHNYKSCVDNDAHPLALRQNLGHDLTLEKNNMTYTPSVAWANEDYFPVEYGDPSIHEYDTEYYGNTKSNNSGYLKPKGSVFSRLSYVHDVSKQENGNNAWNEECDFNNSVDEVMEMFSQSHSRWLTKRKPKPLVKHKKSEILRDKTKIVGLSMKSDCLENTLKNVSMDLTTASECNTNETTEDIYFVDFKRRSKVRKLNDENEIRSPHESETSENLVHVSQKRRKLIRPNFRKSTTSEDKGIDLDVSQNLEVPLSHESYNPQDACESFCSLVHKEDNTKTVFEAQDFICLKQFEDKSSSDAREYICSEGGGKAKDGALAAFDSGSECLENTDNQNASSPASCKDQSCHIKNLESLLSICRECYSGNAIYGRDENTEEIMSKDGESSFTTEVKDGSDCFQKSGNEKAPIETHCRIKEGLSVDNIKSVCKGTESLHSTYQEHQVDKVICAGGGNNTEKTTSEDGGSSFTA